MDQPLLMTVRDLTTLLGAVAIAAAVAAVAADRALARRRARRPDRAWTDLYDVFDPPRREDMATGRAARAAADAVAAESPL